MRWWLAAGGAASTQGWRWLRFSVKYSNIRQYSTTIFLQPPSFHICKRCPSIKWYWCSYGKTSTISLSSLAIYLINIINIIENIPTFCRAAWRSQRCECQGLARRSSSSRCGRRPWRRSSAAWCGLESAFWSEKKDFFNDLGNITIIVHCTCHSLH